MFKMKTFLKIAFVLCAAVALWGFSSWLGAVLGIGENAWIPALIALLAAVFMFIGYLGAESHDHKKKVKGKKRRDEENPAQPPVQVQQPPVQAQTPVQAQQPTVQAQTETSGGFMFP